VDRGDVGDLVQRPEHRPVHLPQRPALIDGVANLLQQADDQGRAEGLLVLGGGDVDGVGGGSEAGGVEVGVGGALADGVGVVGGEDAGGGREDR
jgi:hypothetical protein